MKTFFYVILLATGLRSMAQPLSEIPFYKPVVVFVYPVQYQLQATQSLQSLDEVTRAKYRFLMLADSTSSRASIAKAVNDFLNSEDRIDKQRVYYLEWSESTRSFFGADEKNIFANYHFYQIRQNGLTFNAKGVIAEFESTYLWNIALFNLEDRSLRLNPQLKRVNFGLTYGVSTQNTFTADTAYLPPSINKLGFTIGYRISPHIYLTGRGMLSFKIPNQSKIQSDLQAKINPAAGGSQTLSIDMTSHVFLQGSLQANYFFNTKKRIQPFVGAGLSFLMFQSAKIHQEITIDVSSFASGGGPPSNLGGGLGGGDLPFFKGQSAEPFGVLGLSYQLSRNTRFLLTTDCYYNNRQQLNGIAINSRPLNVSYSAGLQFELNKKTKKYYRYLTESSQF